MIPLPDLSVMFIESFLDGILKVFNILLSSLRPIMVLIIAGWIIKIAYGRVAYPFYRLTEGSSKRARAKLKRDNDILDIIMNLFSLKK